MQRATSATEPPSSVARAACGTCRTLAPAWRKTEAASCYPNRPRSKSPRNYDSDAVKRAELVYKLKFNL